MGGRRGGYAQQSGRHHRHPGGQGLFSSHCIPNWCSDLRSGPAVPSPCCPCRRTARLPGGGHPAAARSTWGGTGQAPGVPPGAVARGYLRRR
ncbi:hypothetical protein SXIM_25260 [Streptomyces xiamenensis]|uniref:Uncharacterized protein n=1 Tax=Streptomyces xiamenensis TaxID=408015 RepID=A0A0F7FUV2_9ACTN|nr:hypothetical protein SXIM_25260 [Streptomyces xiamenensis]